MGSQTFHRDAVVEIPARFQRTLALLLEGAQYAAQTGNDRWEFAVELDQLQATGVSQNDLRLLVRMGLINQASELTLPSHDGRTFRATTNLCFSKRTCFTLTTAGMAAAISGAKLRLRVVQHSIADRQTAPAEGLANVLPKWDAKRHVLTFNGQVVKHFKCHAQNQEVILSAFHEEGWPTRIDDPLSPSPESDAKRRLSDAIRCLNRKQVNELIHFRGDGTGQGVLWEAATQTVALASRTN